MSTTTDDQQHTVRQRLVSALAFRNISALYILAAMVVLFSITAPETFPTINTVRIVLNDQAITAVLAVALTIPLAAGLIDLSIGAQLGLGAILVAWLLSVQGLGLWPSLLVTLAVGAVVGLANGLLITRAKISSFITTLGTSSVLLAGISWISRDAQILDLGEEFQTIATHQVLQIPLAVYFMIGIAVAVWYVIDRTHAGRALYATGGNPEAARLAGVRTERVVIVSLVCCGVLAATAGILLSSSLATGDPTIGPGYLLPAFAAAFLGSTQFRNGRFNVLGTVVAVYVLAIGVKGLQLSGAPVWIPELFNGVALLVAVAANRRQASVRRSRKDKPGAPTETTTPAPAPTATSA
ncbi:ABC transporter permease [Nocardiopsis aegyptia]|uniref:Ribose transport system permease protein n=1 Tax=Nocardiopsis aegyptia TaxID=220378 RepID=A0A7Z0EMY8_9ACTN|nr:ABC transporter permease [Nocardiopsis aegyptia]NYJ35036.1 ribose transport system permease protein [Nocardiopsis aegyptia]